MVFLLYILHVQKATNYNFIMCIDLDAQTLRSYMLLEYLRVGFYKIVIRLKNLKNSAVSRFKMEYSICLWLTIDSRYDEWKIQHRNFVRGYNSETKVHRQRTCMVNISHDLHPSCKTAYSSSRLGTITSNFPI